MAPEKHIWDKNNDWDEELALLRSVIQKTELIETVKWGGPVFTLHNRNVLGIGGFKSYVGVWFFNGVFLKDKSGILVNANEGVTRSLRQWRFKSKEDIVQNENLLLEYIREAIENEKAGLTLKPQKKETVISEYFQAQLDLDAELATGFSTLSGFKQREFIEYIDAAKREETKAARMEKIIPLMKSGIGLNDKYR
jgi:uncharacterized protein YdeI (YjbR/CyaY-like superfamily)